MPLTRNGKIARLPQPLREELNRRLDQGVPGRPLLQWLNSLPEVQAVLAADFGDRPINKQSLSQWRHGERKIPCCQVAAVVHAASRPRLTGMAEDRAAASMVRRIASLRETGK